jgi:hypothetical protein
MCLLLDIFLVLGGPNTFSEWSDLTECRSYGNSCSAKTQISISPVSRRKVVFGPSSDLEWHMGPTVMCETVQTQVVGLETKGPAICAGS